MHALLLQRYGKTNAVLVFGDVAMPEYGAQDILVKNHAVSLNPLDYKIRNGALKTVLPKTFPKILGHDLSGEVVAVGAQVTDFKIGDMVFARIDDGRAGTLAEYSAIAASAAAHKPQGLSHEQAAALPLVSLTVWQALHDIAHLRQGQKVFIPAGSGGIGSVAIQIAKSMGAFVATNTSTKNVDWVKKLGADVVIDYTQHNFSDVLQGYDVVLDTLGGDTLKQAFGILKHGGVLVSIAAPVPTVAAAKTMGLSTVVQWILRLANRPYSALSKKHHVDYHFLFMQANGEQLAHIAQLTEQGQLNVVVDKVYPFSQSKEAFEYLETGRAKGKVVVSLV